MEEKLKGMMSPRGPWPHSSGSSFTPHPEEQSPDFYHFPCEWDGKIPIPIPLDGIINDDTEALKDFIRFNNDLYLPVHVPVLSSSRNLRSIFKKPALPPKIIGVLPSDPAVSLSLVPVGEVTSARALWNGDVLLTLSAEPGIAIWSMPAALRGRSNSFDRDSLLNREHGAQPPLASLSSVTGCSPLSGCSGCAPFALNGVQYAVAIASDAPELFFLRFDAGGRARVVRTHRDEDLFAATAVEVAVDNKADSANVVVTVRGSAMFGLAADADSTVRERGGAIVFSFRPNASPQERSLARVGVVKSEELCGARAIRICNGVAYILCDLVRSFVAVSLRDLSKPEISKTITSPFLSGATDFSLDDKGGKVLIVSSKTSSIVLIDITEALVPREVCRLTCVESLSGATQVAFERHNASTQNWGSQRAFVLSRKLKVLHEVHIEGESLSIAATLCLSSESDRRSDGGSNCSAVDPPAFIVADVAARQPDSGPVSKSSTLALVGAHARSTIIFRPEPRFPSGLGIVEYLRHYMLSWRNTSLVATAAMAVDDAIGRLRKIGTYSQGEQGVRGAANKLAWKNIVPRMKRMCARALEKTLMESVRYSRSFMPLMGIAVHPTLATIGKPFSSSSLTSSSVSSMAFHWRHPRITVSLVDDSVHSALLTPWSANSEHDSPVGQLHGAGSNDDLHLFSIGERSVRAFAQCIQGAFTTTSERSREKISLWSLSPVLRNERQNGVTCIGWRPMAASTLAVGCSQGIALWKVDDGSGVTDVAHCNHLTARGHQYVKCLAWSPDGQFLATGTHEVLHNLVVWEIDTNQSVVLPRVRGGVGVLSFSPCGDFLLSTSASSPRLAVWDKHDGWKPYTVVLPGVISDVAWTSCGQYILASSNEARCIVVVKCNRGSTHTSLQVVDLVRIADVLRQAGLRTHATCHLKKMAFHGRSRRLALAVECDDLENYVIICSIVSSSMSLRIAPLIGSIKGSGGFGYCEDLCFWDGAETRAKTVLACRWYAGAVTFHSLGEHRLKNEEWD